MQLYVSRIKKINILFQLDFLSRYKTRGIKIVGDKGTLLWESNSKNPELMTVKFLGNNKVIKIFLIKKYYTLIMCIKKC